jgi:hypothetical protein
MRLCEDGERKERRKEGMGRDGKGREGMGREGNGREGRGGEGRGGEWMAWDGMWDGMAWDGMGLHWSTMASSDGSASSFMTHPPITISRAPESTRDLRRSRAESLALRHHIVK